MGRGGFWGLGWAGALRPSPHTPAPFSPSAKGLGEKNHLPHLVAEDLLQGVGWGPALLPGAGVVLRLSSSSPGTSGSVFDFFFYPTYLRGRMQTPNPCTRCHVGVGQRCPPAEGGWGGTMNHTGAPVPRAAGWASANR